MVKVVYSRRYDIGFFGLEKLHPFDSRKYGRAWGELKRIFGHDLQQHLVPVDRAVSVEELLLGHSSEYLARLRSSREMAFALEIPTLGYLPSAVLRWAVLRPMRWAVRGTVLATRSALECGVAINLSGGYHHAKPNQGEGFCLFSDIAIAVRQLRTEGGLSLGQRIAYIDLDAHQGNGVCHQFREDRDVFIFDMYNEEIYPFYDLEARDRIDCKLPLPTGCRGGEYLKTLKKNLPGFLDSISRAGPVGLGIYNAGTDVVQDDPLGGLSLTPSEVLERDLFTIGEFQKRNIPVVMLPSGGYTRSSYQLIATSVQAILKQ